MNLPKITFQVQNGGLLQQPIVSDKVVAIIGTGAAVENKIALNTSYQIFSLKEAEDLGIVEGEANDFMHKQIADFYTEAKQGAELWLMLVSDATTYTVMLDANENYAKKLIADAGGAIRILGAVKKSAGNEATVSGLDGDVHTAVPKAQALGTYFAEKYMPVRSIISGNNFSGTIADLLDYTQAENNRVSCLLANNDGSKVASIGLVLGRLARTPVQRNIGRVIDGPIEKTAGYFTNGAKVETLQDGWENIYKKGYIFLRSFIGKSGFYFTDDQTLTAETDDFNSLARGLVMDKAVLLAYATLVENLLDEIEMTESGTIHPAVVKSWQAQVDNALQTMVDAGNLSGKAVNIDPSQNVLTSGVLQMALKLLPVGYAKEIAVLIGFTTSLDN